MNITTLFSIAIGCFLLTGFTVVKAKEVEREPYLNQDRLVGLTNLGNDIVSVAFDYSFDAPSGEELPLESCITVNNTSENNVVESQYHLLQLMRMNCNIISYYFDALKNHRALNNKIMSFLPETFSVDFITSLPAVSIPDLGGQTMDNREGTLAELEKTLEVVWSKDKEVRLLLSGDMRVTYILMARGDFNGDGFEDVLLRLGWRITTAFGRGNDLIMVTQTSKDAKPELIWRR